MAKEPTPRFTMIGKGKFVHVIHTEAWDRKNSQCLTVRKAMVANRIDYAKKNKGLSPEAALALDGCDSCATATVAKRMLPAEEKRAAAKEARDEVLERAKGKNDLTKKARKNRETVKNGPSASTVWYRAEDGRGWTADIEQALRDEGGNVIESKTQRKMPASKKPKAEAKPKSTAPTKTKSGTRSTGSDANAKANALAQFCEDNGWTIGVGVDKDTDHIVVTATRDGSVINAYFIDGKYDVARHATIQVGSWSGMLRGAHAVRRQVDQSLDDRDRPHPAPGKGRSGPRKKDVEPDVPEDESPEDAARRVPFLLDDDEANILDAVMGKKIRWRNGTSQKIEEAVVPSKVGKGKRPMVAVTEHPKTGRRMLDFLEVVENGKDGEVVGPERIVALDRIVRVVA